jgi:hypothetical protein
MPNNNVTVRAQFRALPTILTSVNNSAWGMAWASQQSAGQGAWIVLEASPHQGYEFDRWEVVSGGVVLSDINAPSASFTMPNNNVSVRAHFRLIQASAVSVSVSDPVHGSAAASHAIAVQGTVVTLTASPFGGFEFERWVVVSGGITLDDPTSHSTSFTMPGGNVSVRADFRSTAPSEFNVFVEASGHGDAGASPSVAAQGSTVSILAIAYDGYAFSEWVVISGGAVISNAFSPDAAFTMPGNDVTIRAVFHPLPTEPPEDDEY